jgi:hypothetical protein
MSDLHAIMLLDVAPKVAEMFRSDPGVAELIDPAVLVDANEEGCPRYSGEPGVCRYHRTPEKKSGPGR